MKAPEKIYLQVCGDCTQTDCEGCKFEDLEDDITWWKDRMFPKDIEYTRTDILEVKKVEPNTTELRPKKKTVRPHPLEVAAARHARFDILGWIIKRFKKARNHDNWQS